MNSSVRPELPTPAHHPASYGRSAGCRAGVDNSALFPTLPVSTYKSGIAVQTNRATSFVVLKRLALTDFRPNYLSVENGCPDMLELLVNLGYSGFKFINQAKTQEMQCPRPALEGNDIAWFFPWSSSGPFGEDTPGTWKNAAEILVDIKAYWDNPDRDANVHGWYDLHAKFAQKK